MASSSSDSQNPNYSSKSYSSSSDKECSDQEQQCFIKSFEKIQSVYLNNSQKPNTNILKASKSGSKQPLLETNKSNEENSYSDDSHEKLVTKKPEASKQASKNASKKGKSVIARRVWYEDDEIKLLNWVFQCKTEKGIEPSSDMTAFHKFMENSVNVTKKQLLDKIGKLKAKYFRADQKREKAALGSAHDKQVFHLSKKIWGGNVVVRVKSDSGEENSGEKAKGVECLKLVERKTKVVESSAKSRKRKVADQEGLVEKPSVEEQISSKRVKKVQSLDLVVEDENEVKEEGFWDNYPRLKEALEVENSGLLVEEGKMAMLRDLSKLGDAWARDMEHKWKEYQAKEAELKMMELDLLIEDNQGAD